MRRTFPIALCAAVTASTLAVALGTSYSRYTHPDVRGRATNDLRKEAISLTVEYIDEPFAAQWPRMERQRQIVAELSRRQPAEAAILLAQETAEEARQHPPTDLASAAQLEGHN